MLRIVTVVNAHMTPAANPIRSPIQARGNAALARPTKPSPNAQPTPTNAAARPTHCQPCSRSPGMKRGNNSATQNGDAYKNTVSRDAVVYCNPR
ncbi:hypothetical protein D3C71_1373920 [compost metagenome]